MEPGLEDHLEDVLDALCCGTVVPLLGAGANLCDRANGERLGARATTCRAAASSPRYLADKLHYPDAADGARPPAVSQYGQSRRGDGTLFRYLHEVFTQGYRPTRLHRFLATLPERLERTKGARRHQLIVTTNYDDALEQALDAAGQEYDVVWYERPARATGRCAGTASTGVPTASCTRSSGRTSTPRSRSTSAR